VCREGLRCLVLLQEEFEHICQEYSVITKLNRLDSLVKGEEPAFVESSSRPRPATVSQAGVMNAFFKQRLDKQKAKLESAIQEVRAPFPVMAAVLAMVQCRWKRGTRTWTGRFRG
jgi:hypothetical protein